MVVNENKAFTDEVQGFINITAVVITSRLRALGFLPQGGTTEEREFCVTVPFIVGDWREYSVYYRAHVRFSLDLSLTATGQICDMRLIICFALSYWLVHLLD